MDNEVEIAKNTNYQMPAEPSQRFSPAQIAGASAIILIVVFGIYFLTRNLNKATFNQEDAVEDTTPTMPTNGADTSLIPADKFSAVVMNDNDVSDDRSRISFDYYKIPTECLKKMQTIECEIFYLQKNSTLEKADVTSASEIIWSINGREVTYQEYTTARNSYLKNNKKEAGYMVGNLSVKDGRVLGFDWVKGTDYERIPWSK